MFGGGAYKLPLDAGFVQKLFEEFLGFITKEGQKMEDSILLFETVSYKKILEVPNEKMAFANRGEYYNVATVIKW